MSSEGEHIKVRVPGESLWARRVPEQENRAVICNVPLEEGLFLADVVEITADGLVLRVVERKWPRKCMVRYSPTTREAAQAVAEHIRSNNLGACEGFLPGVMALCHGVDFALPEKLETPNGVVEIAVGAPTTKRFGDVHPPSPELHALSASWEVTVQGGKVVFTRTLATNPEGVVLLVEQFPESGVRGYISPPTPDFDETDLVRFAVRDPKAVDEVKQLADACYTEWLAGGVRDKPTVEAWLKQRAPHIELW